MERDPTHVQCHEVMAGITTYVTVHVKRYINLNSVIVGVSHDDIIMSIDSHTRWLSKLALQHTKLAELTMVDHLLALNLRFGRKQGRVEQFGGEVEKSILVGRVMVKGMMVMMGVGPMVYVMNMRWRQRGQVIPVTVN